MYRNCIFCSAEFGRNECLEAFPVGRQIAFDAEKGRLWAVCSGCGRWNLAPIEERWETVEQAERLYHDTRMRMQRENIGLARMPDGTRLVRVGRPVEGELAAWRYGAQLRHRRTRYFIAGAGSIAVGAAVVGGISAAGGGLFSMLFAKRFFERRREQKVLYKIDWPDSPTRQRIVVRQWHLDGINLDTSREGDIEVHVRDASREKPRSGHVDRKSKDVAVLTGATANKLLARAMARVNRKGATERGLQAANSLLLQAGSADRLIQQAAGTGFGLGDRAGKNPPLMGEPHALALEMALNEESERRALDGELAGLAAAWREAEEIAAIADTLPGEIMLNRFLTRLNI